MSEGADLRAQLDKALEEIAELRASNAGLNAKVIVSEGDFPLVTAADLEGVDPADMAEHAKSTQERKAKEQRDLIAPAFVQRGLTGDDLEKAIDKFLAGDGEGVGSNSGNGGPSGGMLGRRKEIAGSTVGNVVEVDTESLTPQQKIEHGLRSKASKA